jgi:sugar phosphate isomerase/epimerase
MGSLHVHIPFTRLQTGDLPRMIRHRLNPEIAFDAVTLDRSSRSDFEPVAARLRAAGLAVTLHGPFADLSPGSPDPAVHALTRRRLEQMLLPVDVFGPKTVVCHAGYDSKRYAYLHSDWLQRSVEIWSRLAAKLASAGTRLMLENVYEHEPADLGTLLERLAEWNVAACLDVGHQAVFGRTPLEDWIAELADWIGQVHLHDNHGRRDDHLAPGRGRIDFQPLLAFLAARSDHPPLVTLEPHSERDLWDALEFARRHGLASRK